MRRGIGAVTAHHDPLDTLAFRRREGVEGLEDAEECGANHGHMVAPEAPEQRATFTTRSGPARAKSQGHQLS